MVPDPVLWFLGLIALGVADVRDHASVPTPK